jgi:hypothetical protein
MKSITLRCMGTVHEPHGVHCTVTAMLLQNRQTNSGELMTTDPFSYQVFTEETNLIVSPDVIFSSNDLNFAKNYRP